MDWHRGLISTSITAASQRRALDVLPGLAPHPQAVPRAALSRRLPLRLHGADDLVDTQFDRWTCASRIGHNPSTDWPGASIVEPAR